MLYLFSPEARPTSGTKSRNGKGCPRCGFDVYAAEQMISKDKVIIFYSLYSKKKKKRQYHYNDKIKYIFIQYMK